MREPMTTPQTTEEFVEALTRCRNDLLAYGRHLQLRGEKQHRVPGDPCPCGLDRAIAQADLALGHQPYTDRARAALRQGESQ